MGGVSDDWLEAERRIEEARASGVEKLDLSGLDIEMVPASVAGLEQVNWFQFLPHRRVVDVTALKQLPALQKVNLWLCNELCDLSPLTTLANLQHLGLYDCQANLSPLASLATAAKIAALHNPAIIYKPGDGVVSSGLAYVAVRACQAVVC